jgi:hypothetical protein
MDALCSAADAQNISTRKSVESDESGNAAQKIVNILKD